MKKEDVQNIFDTKTCIRLAGKNLVGYVEEDLYFNRMDKQLPGIFERNIDVDTLKEDLEKRISNLKKDIETISNRITVSKNISSMRKYVSLSEKGLTEIEDRLLYLSVCLDLFSSWNNFSDKERLFKLLQYDVLKVK